MQLGHEVEHLELHHLHSKTIVRDEFDWISRISSILGLLDGRMRHHISDPMLEEGILCRLSGTVLTTTPPFTRSSARCSISRTLAETPEGEFKAFKMKYDL